LLLFLFFWELVAFKMMINLYFRKYKSNKKAETTKLQRGAWPGRSMQTKLKLKKFMIRIKDSCVGECRGGSTAALCIGTTQDDGRPKTCGLESRRSRAARCVRSKPSVHRVGPAEGRPVRSARQRALVRRVGLEAAQSCSSFDAARDQPETIRWGGDKNKKGGERSRRSSRGRNGTNSAEVRADGSICRRLFWHR